MLPNILLKRLNDDPENLLDYAGKVLLVVNVASRCGFTSQYKELQALYTEFAQQGLEILAFPCDQFGGQEPGTPEQIALFCSEQYKVTFPVFQKVAVNGANSHQLFDYIKIATPGFLGTGAVKWNFTKFLINRDGLPVKRYASATTPMSIRADIQQLL